ncbi:MAG: phage tail sheath family protein, partial [Gemmatimonadetes bacterium]|nr:phage tail sheath family protein [Gemmatimonadota bacterium]
MGDRFAILDGEPAPATLTATDVMGGVTNSDYAAMYFPWILVYDPVAGATAAVPPSGHVAGIYARVDATRGVHKAPANETVRGALGVQVRVSRNQQGPLNEAGINVIRDINGGITVWGARTLAGSSKPEWKYINVRRLFLFLRESIDEGTQWVVFEPNTPALWAKISRNVNAFLTTVWRNGALFGNAPAEAFYVRCDASTNPPETRELGQVITEIGVSVAKPAEFVIFRLSQWAGPGS